MMKRFVSFLFAGIISLCMLSFPCFADSRRVVEIIDEFDHLSASDEQRVLDRANEVSEATGFHIIIVISDDIGSNKSDSAVVSYSDDIYDAKCGINTDGVLLLINNDTKYDYISTSGSAINYLSDYRISNILEGITPALKNEDYAKAAMGFLSNVETYYKGGKVNHQAEVLGAEVELSDIFGVMIGLGFIPVIVAIVVYAANASQFKLAKASTSTYVMQNSLYLSQKTDTFVGTVTNRVYSPRSSGSSGGGHSGHSSTHHSSGGGRHGGGGHHR